MTGERQYPVVFGLISRPKARIGKKTKLSHSVFEAEVIVRSIASAGASATGIREDIGIQMGMRWKRRNCEIRFRTLTVLSTQLGEFIGSSRSSGRCLFIKGAVDGCGEEKVACAGNRQHWHSRVQRLDDSAFFGQARFYKRPHDAQ